MKAWELLEKAEWVQGYIAIGKSGLSCLPMDPNEEPVAFCLIGAIRQAYQVRPEVELSRTEENPPLDALHALERCYHVLSKRTDYRGTSLASFNDSKGRTKQEVIAVLKEADA